MAEYLGIVEIDQISRRDVLPLALVHEDGQT